VRSARRVSPGLGVAELPFPRVRFRLDVAALAAAKWKMASSASSASPAARGTRYVAAGMGDDCGARNPTRRIGPHDVTARSRVRRRLSGRGSHGIGEDASGFRNAAGGNRRNAPVPRPPDGSPARECDAAATQGHQGAIVVWRSSFIRGAFSLAGPRVVEFGEASRARKSARTLKRIVWRRAKRKVFVRGGLVWHRFVVARRVFSSVS